MDTAPEMALLQVKFNPGDDFDEKFHYSTSAVLSPADYR
jgi:hypothetical protein